MEIREVIELLLNLINDTEEQLFKDKNERIGYYNGREYTRNDFNNMRRVVDRIHRYYKSGSRTSYRYILKHQNYNGLMSLQNYYKRKVNKTQKDYKKMAEIAEKLDVIRKQMEEEKKDKDTQRLLEKERQKVEEERKKELLDKYGFIDDSN